MSDNFSVQDTDLDHVSLFNMIIRPFFVLRKGEDGGFEIGVFGSTDPLHRIDEFDSTTLDPSLFTFFAAAYHDEEREDWLVAKGTLRVEMGSVSEDITFRAEMDGDEGEGGLLYAEFGGKVVEPIFYAEGLLDIGGEAHYFSFAIPEGKDVMEVAVTKGSWPNDTAAFNHAIELNGDGVGRTTLDVNGTEVNLDVEAEAGNVEDVWATIGPRIRLY